MHDFTWFGWISNFVNHGNIHLFSAGLISLVILILAFVYQLKLKTIEEELIPEAGFSFKNVIQSVVEFVLNLMEGIIGHDAKNQSDLNSLNVFYEVKRLIGRKFDDATIQNDLDHYPFKIINENWDF